MPKFRITRVLETEIEAEDGFDAYEQAADLSAGEFEYDSLDVDEVEGTS